MPFTSLTDVPIILVAGEDDDLCHRNKKLAVELLVEQSVLGSSIYCLYVKCGTEMEELVCVMSEDFDTEAIYKSENLAYAIGSTYAEQVGDIITLHWNLSAVSEDGYTPIHDENCIIMPSVCLN